MSYADLEKSFHAFRASDMGTMFIEKEYPNDTVDFLRNKARTINYYKSEGLLPERAKKSNFSFVELVWLRIVFQLREIGVTNDLIRKLKQRAFEPFEEAEFAEMVKSGESSFSNHLAGLLAMVPEDQRMDLKVQLEKAYKEGRMVRELMQNKFIVFLMYLVDRKVPGEIHLYMDGTVEFNTINPDSLPAFYFVHKTYVSISVIEILSYYLSKDFISAALKDIYFTDDEKLILQTVRNEKCESIKINYRDQQIDLIELEKDIKIDKAKRISEVFLANAYEEVNMKTQNGQIVSSKKTTKIKPPKVVK